MSEQELQELKLKVDSLDRMHKYAFAIIFAIGGYFILKQVFK